MNSLPALIARGAVGLLWLFCAALGQAQSIAELKILATDPVPDVMLARQQPFFVRFEVVAATPLAVAVGGWFKGKPVLDNGGSSAPAFLPAGGIGVVSLFYWGEQPTRIDEVRLQLTDARSGAVINDYAFPVALTWLSDDHPPRQSAAWVTAWQQAATPKSSRRAQSMAAPTLQPVWWMVLAVALLMAAAGLTWRWRHNRAAADDGAPPRC